MAYSPLDSGVIVESGKVPTCPISLGQNHQKWQCTFQSVLKSFYLQMINKMLFTFSSRWLGRTVSRLLGRWNNAWIYSNQSESVNSFFFFSSVFTTSRGKSIIGKEHGQDGVKLCKIVHSLDLWPLMKQQSQQSKEPFDKRVNWESHNWTTFAFLAMIFATSWEKASLENSTGRVVVNGGS